MEKTILMYWPTAGNVEKSAKTIAKQMGNIEAKPINEVGLDDLQSNENYILGCSTVGASTWDSSENQDPWPNFMKMLDKIGINNKTVALFGLGDQIRWPQHFVDGMAVIHEQIKQRGAKIIGRWSVEGYDHEESEAQEGGFFVGLALDEDQQAELSLERIKLWIKQITSD